MKGLYYLCIESNDTKMPLYLKRDAAFELYQKYGELADRGYDDAVHMEIEGFRDIKMRKPFKAILRFEYLIGIYMREADPEYDLS